MRWDSKGSSKSQLPTSPYHGMASWQAGRFLSVAFSPTEVLRIDLTKAGWTGHASFISVHFWVRMHAVGEHDSDQITIDVRLCLSRSPLNGAEIGGVFDIAPITGSSKRTLGKRVHVVPTQSHG